MFEDVAMKHEGCFRRCRLREWHEDLGLARDNDRVFPASHVRGWLLPIHGKNLAVGMEAAALYAFARERGEAVLCLAHVTNAMGLADQDFEKGEAQGAKDALTIIEALCKSLRPLGPNRALAE
jgi:hypothetical protein